MIKHIFALFALSLAIVLAMTHMQQGINFLLAAHHWVSQQLSDVFSAGQTGNLLRGLLALLAIPVTVALVPAVPYWLVRRQWFPYFVDIIWVIWLLQAGALLVSTTSF